MERMMPIKFSFNERKAIQALVYISSQWPGVTAFYVAKIFYIAEKSHINKYARPIIGDTYCAFENGPVPSSIYDFIKKEFDLFEYAEMFDELIEIRPAGKYKSVYPKKQIDFDELSDTDIACLTEAITFCHGKTFKFLSEHTHDRAWHSAPANQPMKYEDIIEDTNQNKKEILASAREFAAYGVL